MHGWKSNLSAPEQPSSSNVVAGHAPPRGSWGHACPCGAYGPVRRRTVTSTLRARRRGIWETCWRMQPLEGNARAARRRARPRTIARLRAGGDPARTRQDTPADTARQDTARQDTASKARRARIRRGRTRPIWTRPSKARRRGRARRGKTRPRKIPTGPVTRVSQTAERARGAAVRSPGGSAGPAARRLCPGGRWTGPGRGLAAHWQFSVVLAVAVALRCVVMLGYRPILWYSDSYNYIADAVDHIPDVVRSSGYPLFLLALLPLRDLTLVAALQALMGVLMGVAIYAVLRRRGLPWWGATLPALPVLFDVFELQLEHLVMSDALFIVLITVAVAALCWFDQPPVTCARARGADDRLRRDRPGRGGTAAGRRGGGPAAAPGELEARGAAAGRGPRADRRLHGLVPLVLRAVRPGRRERHVPVQPGQQLLRMRQDAKPRPGPEGPLRPAAAGPAARLAAIPLVGEHAAGQGQWQQPILQARRQHGRPVRQGRHRGPAGGLRRSRAVGPLGARSAGTVRSPTSPGPGRRSGSRRT